MIHSPLAAQTACDHAGLSFARTFRNQFTLSKSPDLVVEGFRVTQLGDWRLHHCRALPYARLHSHDGTPVGIVLGIAVDGAGARVTDGHRLTFGETPEAFVTNCAGRYVMLTETAAYADPTGSMGGVYDADTQTVASTVLMCLDRPPTAPEGFDAKAIMTGKGVYSLGYTRDHAVRAITPNHRLDLNTFTLTRFWPTADTDISPGDPDAIIAGMATRFSQVIGAIVRSTSTLLPISGGHDSRNLLACALPHIQHVDHIYTFVMNWQNQIDAELAAQVMQTLDLPHHIHASYHGADQPRDALSPKARRRQKLAFRLAGGYVGDANPDILDGLVRRLPRGVLLRGNVLESLKAIQWRRAQKFDAAHPDGFDLDYATARLAIYPDKEHENVPRFRGEYAAWREALPAQMRGNHYDLSRVEHSLPGFQPKFFGYTRNFFVNPFCDRALIAACMRLPVAERQAHVYCDALLAHAAPQLSDIPYTDGIKKQQKRARQGAA